MLSDLNPRSNRPSKRHSSSLSKAKPLAYIYHNPILRSSGKQRPVIISSNDPSNLSVKVLDLQLPLIAVPRLVNKFLNNCHRVFKAQKSSKRCTSLIPELCIATNNGSIN
jgi:hypothetical protein